MEQNLCRKMRWSLKNYLQGNWNLGADKVNRRKRVGRNSRNEQEAETWRTPTLKQQGKERTTNSESEAECQ